MDPSVMLQAALQEYDEDHVRVENLRVLQPDSDYLADLRDTFMESRQDNHCAKIDCFWEQIKSNVGAIVGGQNRLVSGIHQSHGSQAPTYHIRVKAFAVDETSGCLDLSKDVEKHPLARNHFNMNKFSKTAGEDWFLVSDAIYEMATQSYSLIAARKQGRWTSMTEDDVQSASNPSQHAPAENDDKKLAVQKLWAGATPLHFAARQGRVEMVKHLYKQGHDPGARAPETDIAPMHSAAFNGDIAMIDLLRDLGQDIAVQEKCGVSPIHLAAYQGHITLVDHLHDLGQDLGVRDKMGRTTMHLAARGGRIAMLDHLRELGHDIWTQDISGAVAMHQAALGGRIPMVEHLKQLGQDVDVKDKFGVTPMHLAAEEGHVAVLEHLK